ncbi:hypothetical protein, partial [Delftia tsuruhatensis]|uniref:hypothetical protein n=1 Tax=Delftia tsuruhatensis TaxID=180282 RepID=UPI00196A1179
MTAHAEAAGNRAAVGRPASVLIILAPSIHAWSAGTAASRPLSPEMKQMLENASSGVREAFITVW